MAQFDVFRNPNPATATGIPFLLDVQSGLLDHLITRVVVPLARPELMGNKSAKYLNPDVKIQGDKLVLLTQELAAIPARVLGTPITSLKDQHTEIIQALDMVFSGV